jgi:hypothetical protein
MTAGVPGLQQVVARCRIEVCTHNAAGAGQQVAAVLPGIPGFKFGKYGDALPS